MALICPRCFTPLDARLGYDFVANQHAHDWNDDVTLHQSWERLLSYERFFLIAIRQRVGRSKKQRLVTDTRGMFGLLLSAENPNYLRPIDMFESAYFPSPTKLGFASRQLMQPFNVCHLVERRKAMAIIIGMLERSVSTFGFRSGTTPTRQIRELMNLDTYDRFERQILNIARQSLPI